MSEARDRLSRPEDVAELYSRLRHHRSIGSLGIRANELDSFLGTPLRRGAATPTATTGITGVAPSMATRASVLGRRVRFGTPNRRVIGRENTPGMGSARRATRLGGGSYSVLPSWYPRTPLHDITAVVGPMERRRRASLRETEGQEIGSPVPPDRVVHTPGVLTSGAQLEHKIYRTPNLTLGRRHCLPSTVGKVPKILLDVASQNFGESEFLTPQKKLLNSLDKVEKVVMEELRKMKRTPSAKKAEREKRVRTLMSMR